MGKGTKIDGNHKEEPDKILRARDYKEEMAVTGLVEGNISKGKQRYKFID